jgi:hypothetical protein
VPKMWKDCSESNGDPCYSKHADDSGLVENVMMRIETRETEDDGQQVCILTEKERAVHKHNVRPRSNNIYVFGVFPCIFL